MAPLAHAPLAASSAPRSSAMPSRAPAMMSCDWGVDRRVLGRLRGVA